MKCSTKAALLSALVFPGVGHFYLEKTVRGVLLAAGAIVLSYIILSAAVDSAFEIAEQIESGDVPIDAESISDLVSKGSGEAEGSAGAATNLLFVLWIIGIIDSYREGRARDRFKEIDAKSKSLK